MWEPSWDRAGTGEAVQNKGRILVEFGTELVLAVDLIDCSVRGRCYVVDVVCRESRQMSEGGTGRVL